MWTPRCSWENAISTVGRPATSGCTDGSSDALYREGRSHVLPTTGRDCFSLCRSRPDFGKPCYYLSGIDRSLRPRSDRPRTCPGRAHNGSRPLLRYSIPACTRWAFGDPWDALTVLTRSTWAGSIRRFGRVADQTANIARGGSRPPLHC